MTGYTAREVAKLLDLPVGRVRAYVGAGFLAPERGRRGEFRFSFQDLVLLKTAKELLANRIPSRRVRTALQKLRTQLPEDRPLSGVTIAAEGSGIVVAIGGDRWNPESGQHLFDFRVADLGEKVEKLTAARPAPDEAARGGARAGRGTRASSVETAGSPPELDAEEWYDLGCDLEDSDPVKAREAYERAVSLDPHSVEALTNLGRLLHEAGELDSAEAHYRRALVVRPDEVTALFNLAVVLEDRKRLPEAIGCYEHVIQVEPRHPDAHYNLARLFEEAGQVAAAVRHLQAYRRLTRGA